MALATMITMLAMLAPARYAPILQSQATRSVSASTALANTTDNLFWFIQVNDIHVSRFRPEWEQHFRSFLTNTLPFIRPALVTCPGDLVDSYATSTRLNSQQNEVEWQTYRSTLEEFGLFDATKWLDIRGNHDDFDVPFREGEQDFYRRYSVNGALQNESRVVEHIVTMPFGQYQFVLMDLTPDPGPLDAANYFATADDDVTTELEAVLARSASYNHTFLLAHYPYLTIGIPEGHSRTTGRSFSEVVEGSTFMFWLSGHWHKKGMFTRRSPRFLDIELASMQQDHEYRIIAVDNDMVSFLDTNVNHPQPLILATNPKDAAFLSEAEPWQRIGQSTHVRVVIFTRAPNTAVSYQINNEAPVVMQAAVAAPPQVKAVGGVQGATVFTAPWTPSRYASGLHHIKISASDAAGGLFTKEYQFSVDGTTAPVPYSTNAYQAQWHIPAFLISVFTILAAFSLLWVIVASKLFVSCCLSRDRDRQFRLMYMMETYGVQPVYNAVGSSHAGVPADTVQLQTGVNPPANIAELDRVTSAKHVLFWQPLMSLWLFGRIRWLYWIPLCVAAVWMIALPWTWGPLSANRWGVLFSFGMYFGSSQTVSAELPLFLGCLWWFLAFIPLCILAAKSSTPPPLLASQWHKPQLYCGCLPLVTAWSITLAVVLFVFLITVNVLFIIAAVIPWVLSPVVLWFSVMAFVMYVHMLYATSLWTRRTEAQVEQNRASQFVA